MSGRQIEKSKSPTLIDFFRAFQSTAEKNNFATSARVLYYSILHAWNEERRPECLRIRRGTLQDLSGLSESSVRNALSFLATTGWLKLGRVHSKNAPLAIVLRNPCERNILIFNQDVKPAEPERVRVKEEPERSLPRTSTSVTEEARRALKSIIRGRDNA